VASYRVHGVRFGVRSDVADVLRRVDDTYEPTLDLVLEWTRTGG